MRSVGLVWFVLVLGWVHRRDVGLGGGAQGPPNLPTSTKIDLPTASHERAGQEKMAQAIQGRDQWRFFDLQIFPEQPN